MPVSTHLYDGVLVIVVDGEYTSDELRRAGLAGLDGEDVPKPVPVLLDMTGAAGLSKKPSIEIRATGILFAQQAEKTTRVAIVASSDVAYGMMNIGAVFASEAGLSTRVFRARSEATEWLLGKTP